MDIKAHRSLLIAPTKSAGRLTEPLPEMRNECGDVAKAAREGNISNSFPAGRQSIGHVQQSKIDEILVGRSPHDRAKGSHEVIYARAERSRQVVEQTASANYTNCGAACVCDASKMIGSKN